MRSAPGEPDLLYIDLHLVHEVTSPQAFDGLRLSGAHGPPARADRSRPRTTTSRPPTSTSRSPTRSRPARSRCCARTRPSSASRNFPMGDPGQGIVHVIGPEQGRTLPGMTIVCGDSHTATHGAFGALAFGIGTSEVEHVLATQTLPAEPPEVDGRRRRGRAARRRDGQGRDPRHHRRDRHRRRHRPRHRVPRLDDPRPLDGGPHDGLQHVDRGRRQGRAGRPRRHDVRVPPRAGPTPRRARRGTRRSASWRELRSDDGAVWDREVHIDATTLRPQVTWGTNPGQVTSIDGAVPSPDDFADADDPRDRRPGRSSTWASRPARRCATSPSTPCSSARARTAASRTCAPPPRCSTAATSRPSG